MISDNLNEGQTTTQPEQGEHSISASEINRTEKAEVKNKGIVAGTEEKLLAGASYIPFLGFVTITFNPKSRFCSFHGNQGIALTILFFVIVFWLLLESVTGSLAFLAWFGISVAGAVKALQGDLWEIPFLSSIAQKIDLSQIMKSATGLLPETEKENAEKTNKEEEKVTSSGAASAKEQSAAATSAKTEHTQ